MMYAQNAVPFPRFLLIMLIAWLTALFMSFGIFGPRNPLVLAAYSCPPWQFVVQFF
jgi:hypothetical protein